MSADLLLGIDVGTGATKAALFDAEGRLRGKASVPTRLHRGGPGTVEQDPAEMEREVHAAIRGALADAHAAGNDVAALALDGQMAGVMFVDDAGAAVGPFDSWLDTRCDPDVATLRPHAERIVARCGGYPTYSAGPKLLWWLRERPDEIGRARAMVMPSAYLAGRLCGLSGAEAYADPTYLHFSCLADTARSAWSPELVDLLGAPDRLLPRIVETTDVVGEVTRDAAAATGLRAGTPVAAGCGDTAAGVLGAGVVRPATALDVAGSAAVLAVCTGEFRPDVDERTLLTARTALPGLYYALGYVQGGGLNLGWFRDAFARELRDLDDDAAFAALDAEARDLPPGAEGVAFAPHLGGRVTPNDPHQRGMWHGFGWTHGRGHLYRSLLEGIALEYGLYLRGIRRLHPDLGSLVVRAVGGGARSALWGGIKADVLGAAYRPLRRQEGSAFGGALGCALLAGQAAGLLDDVAEAAERINELDTGPDPDPVRSAAYAPLVDDYANLLEAAGALGRARASHMGGAA
ncbi:MAG: FGGY family carbohydrate kinase [Trueperaceae bacterium]